MATVGSKVFLSLDSGSQRISPATASFTWADTTSARRVAPSPSVTPSPSKEQRVFGHVGILRVEASQRGVLHRVRDCPPHSSPSPSPLFALEPSSKHSAAQRLAHITRRNAFRLRSRHWPWFYFPDVLAQPSLHKSKVLSFCLLTISCIYLRRERAGATGRGRGSEREGEADAPLSWEPVPGLDPRIGSQDPEFMT